MDILRSLFGMRKLQPYKVQDATRKVRYGIAALSLSDLQKKGREKLKIKGKCVIVLEEDGTEIDSDAYFQTLPPQTVFVFLKPCQTWDGYISYLKLAMDKISENISAGNQTLQDIQEILQDDKSPEMALLAEYVNNLHANINAENRDEDPTWFDGIQHTIRTKDMAMRLAAKARIRNYLAKIREFVSKLDVDKSTKRILDQIIDCFQCELKACKFNGSYFSRRAKEEDRLCSKKGWFYCEGPYNAENCDSSHAINPYGTRDSRVLFSTWNLDHRIEKNREILPKMVQAVVNCPANKSVNWRYFFELLFTRVNLSLVEVRCHLKEKHDEWIVDPKRMYKGRDAL